MSPLLEDLRQNPFNRDDTVTDFRKTISPKSQKALLDLQKWHVRFSELNKADMGTVLLAQSRLMRSSGLFDEDIRYSYDAWALCRVLPEIAQRLNPGIELDNSEKTRALEFHEAQFLVVGAKNDKLAQFVNIVTHHTSFDRVRSEYRGQDPKVFRAGHLFDKYQPYTIATIAMDNLHPGCFPSRPYFPKKPDLTGLYVIAETHGQHRVLSYAESSHEAIRIAEDTVRSISSGESNLSVENIQIQNFQGEELWRSEMNMDKDHLALSEENDPELIVL